jgi:hypothetical protein
MSSKNEYSALPSRTSFRLLNLLPGEENDPIAYSLVSADWEVPSPYEAVSYAWGNASQRISTYCDGKILEVTKSLHDALFHLRRKDRLRVLWADAVWYASLKVIERHWC